MHSKWSTPKKLGRWEFRVKKFGPGSWGAQVSIGGVWFAMLEPRGVSEVRRVTRADLWRHIRYAYGIPETGAVAQPEQEKK